MAPAGPLRRLARRAHRDVAAVAPRPGLRADGACRTRSDRTVARDRRPGAGRGPGRGAVERDPRLSDERDRRGGRGRLRRVGRRAVRDGHRVARHSGVVNAHPPPPATGYPGAALVTGAARGIGAAVARRLAADGFRVVCADACAGATDPVLAYPLATREELDATI